MIEQCRTELLSDYIDDELEPVARQQVEEHIAECATCRAALSELRKVVRRAGGLEDAAPSRDLWPGIAARIGAAAAPHAREARRVRRRWVAFSVPQLLAAGIAAVTLAGAAGWVGARWSRGTQEPPVVALDASPGIVPSAVSFETRYDGAIEELMAAFEQERERLSPSAIRVIEENLLIIDAAIARAQEALMSDPGSDYVRDHLDQTVRRKFGLLRRVTEMTSRS